jgi:hypothetical protein
MKWFENCLEMFLTTLSVGAAVIVFFMSAMHAEISSGVLSCNHFIKISQLQYSTKAET